MVILQSSRRPTFFTHADIQQPRTRAVSRGDAEAGVGCGVGEHLARRTEAVGGDPLHHHVLLIDGIQRPAREGRTRVNSSRNRLLLFHHSHQDFICPSSSPAQVRGEHVELFLFPDDRVEGRTVGSVDHVALVGRPPVQRAGKFKAKVGCEMWQTCAAQLV